MGEESGSCVVAGAPPAAAGAGALRLEERLSSASMRRQLRLRAVVERAAHRHAQVRARAAGARANDHHLATQLTECLQRAAAARDARLAAVAGKAGEAVARAREAAAEAKLRAEMEASQRRLLLLQRLERAERARQEALQAMAAGRSHRNSPEGFLTRQATRRAQLRRQSSSRKLQAAWRAFCEQQQTTRALAQGFAATRVPFTVPLEEQTVGPQLQLQPQPVAVVAAPSSDPTPAGTPDPCGSPTSTVRRHDGRLASAPTSIPQTPHTTPAHSLAGSPTRRSAGTPLPGPATPAPLAMPPLRSIASHGQEAPEPAGSSFEQLAAAISSPGTLQAAQALLARLEARVSAKGVAAGSCAPLLRRLFPRAPPGSQPRYPARIFLCAYMVLAHPEVVFNSQGEREASLASAARSMLSAFEPLLARLAEPAVPPAGGAAAPADADAVRAGDGAEAEDEAAPMPAPLADMLQLFDERWIMYLEQFVCWKSADAAGLESELIRVAVELESSRLAKVAGGASPAARLRSPEDIQAIANQVDHDLRLIGDRVHKLGGAQGSARLAAALAAVRAAAAPERTLSQDAEPQSPTAAAAGLSRSPSQSPARKAPRSRGEYTGDSARSDGATLSRSSSSVASSSPAEHPVDVAAALAQHKNLALMWHLLYDPDWQLSTADLEALLVDALGDSDPLADAAPALEEGTVAAVQLHVKRLAERAFWAALQEQLVGSDEGEQRQAVEQVTELLADLGAQLAEVLPAGAAEVEEVRLQLGRVRLQEVLPAAGGRMLDLPALLGLLDWAGHLVLRFGAPARDQSAAAGQAAVRRQLASAGADPAAVAAVAVRGLRLLAAQLKLLRLDAANFQLRLLARQLRADGAAAYAATKFGEMLGSAQGCSPEQLGQRLPHTRAWLAAASGQLPHMEQMEAVLLNEPSAASAAQAPALPQLRAGLRASASGAGSASTSSKIEPLAACQARSWRGLVRLGLVSLVSGEGTTMRLPTPETLCLDGARLHAAQGELQQLLVTATCLLLVRQSAGRAMSPAEVEAAKRRLRAVLSDPAVRLPDIGAECAKLAGGEPDAARERGMHDSLQRMLSRGAGALKALTSGVKTALLAPLVLGVDSAPAHAHAALALRKCGAGDLVGEVRALALELSRLAQVTEAVAAPWYQALSADLL